MHLIKAVCLMLQDIQKFSLLRVLQYCISVIPFACRLRCFQITAFFPIFNMVFQELELFEVSSHSFTYFSAKLLFIYNGILLPDPLFFTAKA